MTAVTLELTDTKLAWPKQLPDEFTFSIEEAVLVSTSSELLSQWMKLFAIALADLEARGYEVAQWHDPRTLEKRFRCRKRPQ